MKVSIVIPAYRPVALLSACISGILKNTDMTDVEVIVVCNGSDKESATLVLNTSFKLFWTDEALGFTKAANIGLRLATGDYVIVLNTDAVILDYAPQNEWLLRLTAPFENSSVGVTGLGFMWTPFGHGTYAPFYCAAIRRSLFDEIGYLDEQFSPGYCEDADFCYRVVAAGYELVQVDHVVPVADNTSTVTDFPIWHAGEQSYMDKEKRQMYVNNGIKKLEEKWGKL